MNDLSNRYFLMKVNALSDNSSNNIIIKVKYIFSFSEKSEYSYKYYADMENISEIELSETEYLYK